MQEFLDQATWTHPPVSSEADGGNLLVEAVQGSDYWEKTYYGFQRDSGHALLAPVTGDGALEVTFKTSYDSLYDQAGLMIRTDESNWIKAGVEITDGEPHVGAVVTREYSDWSLSPVPEWAHTNVTIRASWTGNSVVLRARSEKAPWRTIRVAHLDITGSTRAGLYVAAPERAGLTVSFSRASFGPADESLHAQPAEQH
ncbi:DUF1349 domain-containing protein [Arthrobacter sp. Sa2BUA2]|uniref:DUF1349 domain-containing protein n=1 Tax=Arthrobacter pullicola TaxID=2762224 RepID=A0ABR8YFF2_9MICC|nr:DUF1349 domain-containing protein [Arthrobacter pullicola]MBD8042714.1 DUF1349 domain-containing protein [Arthrobacter pullicola]